MKIPFNIFPVGADKAPLIKGWQDKATRDQAVIAKWQAQGVKAWGIPTGAANGLCVIDLDKDDTTGEPVGETNLRSLPRFASLLDHANMRTPSGGLHIYCKHFDGARNTTSKIAPKIDTRGEGGYVVAPGSEVASGRYVGNFPEVLPTVPMGLRALLLHQPAPPRQSFDRVTPAGEVEELLGHIPADLPYCDWVTVLMALHDRYGGSYEGLAIADQWSSGGSKYRNGEVAAKWHSFKRSGVSWATIPALARQNGANLPEIGKRWAA